MVANVQVFLKQIPIDVVVSASVGAVTAAVLAINPAVGATIAGVAILVNAIMLPLIGIIGRHVPDVNGRTHLVTAILLYAKSIASAYLGICIAQACGWEVISIAAAFFIATLGPGLGMSLGGYAYNWLC